jgi:NADH:ubiquinone oxidoreductase subunit 5 (subunit L)/multisubunit Na+/H+ antiporter MnhA subunit
MAMFGIGVTLLDTLLVGWGLIRRTGPFTATYQYLNMSVAFSGPTNFQTFAINLAFHVDQLSVVALLVIEVCMIAAVAWHQVMGRSEPGAARFHALITLLLFACAGILVSYDLAELFAFWAMGGALTYLLLAHRWGVDAAAAQARVVLALPFLTDLCLLCGIAWFYARYGTQNLATLLPILHTNPGWTTRSIVLGSALLFVGVAGRLALWPFSGWITMTSSTAPTAASAIAQSAWSVVGIVLLYRLSPIFVASNQRTLQAFLVACAFAAVAAGVISLFGNGPRRVISLAGSGAVAVGAAVVINGAYHQPAAFAIAGVAAVLAIAPARAAALLAVSTLANAMRTDDLAEMGDAWRRMRASSGALLVSAVVIGLAASGALAYGVSSRSKLGIALGEAVLLVAVAALRVFIGASFGILRRRRAFDPDRVREPQQALAFPYWLAGAGAVLLVASFITGWLHLLDGQKHPTPSPAAIAVWVAIAGIGFAACAFAFTRSKDGALGWSAAGGAFLRRYAYGGLRVVDRFLVAPTTDAARRLSDWIPAGDGAVGRFAIASGQLALAAGRGPAVPIIVGAAILLALVLALAAPGIVR